MTPKERMLSHRARSYMRRSGFAPKRETHASARDAAWAVLLFLDRAVSSALPTIFWGETRTISGRLGRVKRKHGGRIPAYFPLAKAVDWGLDLIDENHSIDAHEAERVA